MTSCLQLWRKTFFRIFDNEYLRNRKRQRYNSFTVAIYSTEAITWRLFSIIWRKKSFSKTPRKVVRRWKRLEEQNSNHFSEWKYLFYFQRYRRKCANQKLNSICRAGLNYDVMIAVMMLCIFSNLWHRKSRARKEIQI